jgi:ferric-dicitrate binding protein FerR (iron transport regulator)
MKSLDRSSLEEQVRLVPRYVAGDLSRSERADFEAWLVASPELAAEVEMERRFRRGIASAARRGWIDRSAPVKAPQERRWSMAIAASVLVTVGLAAGLAFRQGEDSGGDSRSLSARSGEPAASPLMVRLGRTRSLSEQADIRLSLADLPSQLVIEPDVVVLTCADGAVELECADGSLPQLSQYPEYEMDFVYRRASTLAWRSARQQPAMGAGLSFTMRDPAILKAGDYDVVVRGVSANHEEVVGRFWLNVAE